MPLLVAEENEDLFGARLMRSSTLLATSSPERKQPVFVLIYGQSITGSKSFTDNMQEYLEQNFRMQIYGLKIVLSEVLVVNS